MKTVNVAELEGVALDWAVAQIDPMCNGLTWEVVPGGKVGFAVISGEKTPCAFLSHGSCLSERMRLNRDGVRGYSPSTDWSHGGPLIDEFSVSLISSKTQFYEGIAFTATIGPFGQYIDDSLPGMIESDYSVGKTPLIAACRAIVAAKFGDTVEVPEELL